jgi:hypothetical protein
MSGDLFRGEPPANMKEKDEDIPLCVLTGRRNREKLQEFTFRETLWQRELHLAALGILLKMIFLKRSDSRLSLFRYLTS